MADQKIALIEKLHHSMADGLAAAELATVLLDLSPDLPAPPRGRPWQPVTPQPVWRAALEDLLRLGALSVRAAQWGLRSAWHPLRRAREVTEFGRAVGTLISPKTLAPHSSLNHQITPARRIDFVRLPFAEMQKAAHTTGTTVNDVLLTVVAGGLHQLMESRGELTPNSEVQVLVPVGLPGDPERGMANRVSAQFVRLPIGKDDPWQILRRVAQEVAHNKSHHQELVAATFLQILAPLPQDLLASVAGLAQHQPFFNLIVTNVPGPTIPLYALGAKLLEAFPMVPLAGNQSLGVAALSYEGQLNLGILSDPATCPDADVFCRGVQASLEALVTRLAVPHP